MRSARASTNLQGSPVTTSATNAYTLWIVDRRVYVVAAPGLAKIAVEFDIDLVVLAECGLFGEKPVIGKKAHVAQGRRMSLGMFSSLFPGASWDLAADHRSLS